MSGFGTLPPAQQRRELSVAERRRREEAAQAAAAALPHPDAVAARRPGLDRPGQRQLRRPHWLAAATAGVHTPEDAAAALEALRSLQEGS